MLANVEKIDTVFIGSSAFLRAGVNLTSFLPTNMADLLALGILIFAIVGAIFGYLAYRDLRAQKKEKKATDIFIEARKIRRTKVSELRAFILANGETPAHLANPPDLPGYFFHGLVFRV